MTVPVFVALHFTSYGVWVCGSWIVGAIKEEEDGGQVIYLPKMFRVDEKLEFKSDNSTTMTNNIPNPIASFFR
jgi:hypothetical protein